MHSSRPSSPRPSYHGMVLATGPRELEREMKQGEIAIIDLRSAAEYHGAHIPGAVHLPREKWRRPAGLKKDRVNVVYGATDTSAIPARAAVHFATCGYTVLRLEGGFAEWQQHGLPVTTPVQA